MEDSKLKAKKAVLEELMAMMDEKMLNGMKSKSPKFMKVEIASEEQSSEEGDEVSEDQDPKEEMPEMAMSKDDEEDEDLERLKDLYSRLK